MELVEWEICPCGGTRPVGVGAVCSLEMSSHSDGVRCRTSKMCEYSDCENIILSTEKGARFCGRRCSRNSYRVKNLENVKARQHEREALQRGAGVSRLVTQLQVWEKSKGFCWICGLEMIREWNHSALCFTMDHVIPVTLGGSHTLENLEGAHFGCNNSKNNKLIEELPKAWKEQRQQIMLELLELLTCC